MKPVRVYQDCAVCDLGKPAKIFMDKAWWRTTPVLSRRDTPAGMPRFETRNTIYIPDEHDGGDPLNQDYHIEKVNLSNPFALVGRYVNDEFLAVGRSQQHGEAGVLGRHDRDLSDAFWGS